MTKTKRFIAGAVTAATLLSTVMLAPATMAADAPALKGESTLLLSKDGTMVFGTGGAITAAALAGEFDGDVTVKNPAGEAITGEVNVPSGSTVSTDGGSISVMIHGDANADGAVTLADVTAMLQGIAKWNVKLDEAAADPDLDGGISLGDVTLMLKHIAKWDVKLGYRKVIFTADKQNAAAEDASTVLWATHSTVKLEKKVTDSTGENTYVINAAKNESEGATVYIAPGEEKKNVTVSVTDFENSYGDKVKTEAFTFFYTGMGEYGSMPDAMMPTNSTYKATVKAGESQGFYIKATTADETEAGLYEAVVSIKADGAEIKKAKLYLNVWDFTLDDADAPRSSFGLDKMVPAANHNINGSTDPERYNAMYKTYYDFLLEHRINAFILPYNVETDEADVYITDPRVNSFVVYGDGYGGVMDATIVQLNERYEKLTAMGMADKGYFYCADEPYDGKPSDDYGDMRTTKDLIDQYYPGGKQVVAVETGTHITRYDGFIEYLRETTDILCPKTYAFVPQKYYGTDLGNGGVWELHQPDLARDYGTWAEFAATCVAEEENKESWWYFAGLPAAPMTTYHASVDGMYVRMSGFQMYQENVTGVLYYATTDYRSSNPFYKMDYTAAGVPAYGNGVLLFSGMRHGVDGPIGSVRLEYICDSFEDYMYLRMAERLIGKEATDAIVLKVTRDLVDFEKDAGKMQAVRAELAEAIMAAQAE